jgi:hypothetical protein
VARDLKFFATAFSRGETTADPAAQLLLAEWLGERGSPSAERVRACAASPGRASGVSILHVMLLASELPPPPPRPRRREGYRPRIGRPL